MKAYKGCTESALIRQFAGAEQMKPPPAPPAQQELVARAEHDCANLVPIVISGATGDALVVQTIVAIEHRDLMRHFRGSATTVTTVMVPPAAQPPITIGDATCPRPEYPPAAVRAGARGVSRASLTIDPDGHVTAGRLVGASGPTREHRLLDDAAVDSLLKCQFPKLVDAAPRTVTLDYTWRLD